MNNEPVAWIKEDTLIYLDNYNYASITIQVQKSKSVGFDIPLYTHPVKEPMMVLDGNRVYPTVKELTDEEIMKTCIKHGIYDCISDSYIKDDGTNSLDEDLIRFARAILRKAQEL